MAAEIPSSTISLRERALIATGSEERLPRWLVVSFLLHAILIACLFIVPLLPSPTGPAHPVYVVDLIGGEKIGGANFGTELKTPPKPSSKNVAEEMVKETKKETVEKVKPVEKKPPEEKIVLKEKPKPEPTKKEAAQETKAESASADSVRERLLQSALDRAKTRGDTAQKPSKGEPLSSGSGEGAGAAGLGQGGRGGPGVVRGIDFVVYQNRIFGTIKENWAWPGQRSDLRVVVQFGIKDNGEIFGLKIVKPSGDPSYDESVLRAVKKSNPLPAPPESYRKEFADVELTFRPSDLGA